MPYFRKKPVVIEAMEFAGGLQNVHDIQLWSDFEAVATDFKCNEMMVSTLEGQMTASIGDWIIKGVNGEFYPCKPGIFAKTYERLATPSLIND